MWHAVFTLPVPVLEKIVRTVLVYATILVLFRIAGKRDLAGLSTLDFAVVFLLSNIVQNAVIGADDSFTGGLIGAVTLMALNAVLGRLIAVSPAASRVLQGRATTVIEDGRPVPAALRRLALRTDELEHAVRLQNGDALDEVQRGVLEPGGQLVLTLRHDEQAADKSDVARILERLDALEGRLDVPR